MQYESPIALIFSRLVAAFFWLLTLVERARPTILSISPFFRAPFFSFDAPPPIPAFTHALSSYQDVRLQVR